MKIDQEHFEYLHIQRGEVSGAYSGDDPFKNWKKAYELSLSRIFDSIRPVLPTACARVIDVGSGLGGIDVLLAEHYESTRGQQPVVCLVDGVDDEPKVDWHFKTFSNQERALDFLKKNGVKFGCYFSPQTWPTGHKADLIVSFAAYCFHIPVGDYIEEVKRSCHKQTVQIFEVRKTKREWLEVLVRAFGKPVVLAQTEKMVRCAFNAKV